ncbi:MAG: GNAT family N-acetyltransferase [Nocardioides sp.]|uniref:GNAT family N-acetyltransferase n=1 Tax=Nocardioides sp. TaxID=35761 RepID=UPI0039E2226E
MITDLTVTVAAEPPPDWDDTIEPEQAFAKAAWLTLFDGRTSAERVWFALRRNGVLVAGMPGHVQREPSGYPLLDVDLLNPVTSPFLDQAGPADPVTSPGLELPCLWLVMPGLTTFTIGPGAADPATGARLVDAIERWAASQGFATVIAPYTSAQDTALSSALAGAGWIDVPLTEEAWLVVPAGGWAEHLATLPQHRRKQLRRERRHLAEAGVVTGLARPDELDACARLLVQQRTKYGRLTTLDQERAQLDRLRRLADHVVVVARAGQDGSPLSFVLFSVLGADWHAMATGTDYTDERANRAYFEVLFYAATDHAAAAGARRICYGHGTVEAKRRRGCDMVGVTAWLSGSGDAERRAQVARAWKERG